MICRSAARLMIFDASTTRLTSAAITSRSSPETATIPRLFKLCTCSPVIPTYTCEICTPAIRSARSVAVSIALTVSSRSVMTPLRIPVEGASPTPMISRPSGPLAATTVHVFVVPISRPAIVSCFMLAPPPIYWAWEIDFLLQLELSPPDRDGTARVAAVRLVDVALVAPLFSERLQIGCGSGGIQPAFAHGDRLQFGLHVLRHPARIAADVDVGTLRQPLPHQTPLFAHPILHVDLPRLIT